MRKIALLVVTVLALIMSATQVRAAGGWMSAFNLNQPITLSWSLGPNVALASPLKSRTIDVAVSDPWTPINFETGFRESEAGQHDDVVVMSGNTDLPLMLCHSGYFRSHDQLCEWLRFYIQGGWTNKEKTWIKLQQPGVVTGQITDLPGTKMTLTQNKVVKTWKMAFLVTIKHDDVTEFDQSADEAVSVIFESMTEQQQWEYKQRVVKGEKPLLLATCSWRAENTSYGWGVDVEKQGWGSYGRYVAVMFPDKVPDVKP